MTPKDMDPGKSNVIDLDRFREIETPSLGEIWRLLPELRREFGTRPAILRREVDQLQFADLQGRAALVADIRRELDHLEWSLEAEPPAQRALVTPDGYVVQDGRGGSASVGNGGGLIWRLAMLSAYDAAANVD